MKFSIIIPIYNRAKFIASTLNSVLNQTYSNIEIVCVNDYSTDNSLELLNEYQKKDNRIRVINQTKNLGTQMARKTGVQHATGNYVMFLDCDDKLKVDACEIIYENLKQLNCEVLEFAHINMQNNNISLPAQNITVSNLFDSLVYFKNPRAGTIWNKAYKAELVKKAFSNTTDFYSIMGQDFYQSVVIAYYTESYNCINDVLYEYNITSGVSTKTDTVNSVDKYLKSIKNDIIAFDIFFNAHTIKHKNAVNKIESFFIKHMYYNQILSLVKKSEWKEALQLLPNYFSEKAVQPYLKKINKSLFLIQLDFTIYKLNKKIRKLMPRKLKRFIKKLFKK